jgi:hypothetical protein
MLQRLYMWNLCIAVRMAPFQSRSRSRRSRQVWPSPPWTGALRAIANTRHAGCIGHKSSARWMPKLHTIVCEDAGRMRGKWLMTKFGHINGSLMEYTISPAGIVMTTVLRVAGRPRGLSAKWNSSECYVSVKRVWGYIPRKWRSSSEWIPHTQIPNTLTEEMDWKVLWEPDLSPSASGP